MTTHESERDAPSDPSVSDDVSVGISTSRRQFLRLGRWVAFGNASAGPTDRTDINRAAYILNHNGKQSGTLVIFVNDASFDREVGRHVSCADDARWRCRLWMSNIDKHVNDWVLPSFSASIGIVGSPMVLAVRHKETALLLWKRSSGGVLIGGNAGLACGECVGCRSRELNVRQDQVSFVYFIQSKDGGPIKIGCTTDVEKRRATLQTAHATELRVLATMRGGHRVEKSLHEGFTNDRVRHNGEWFRPSSNLLDFIREIGGTV